MGSVWKRPAHKGLSMEFDEKQTECLMVVGLWCCRHPDPTIRPSIRQVINVLNSEAPLPNLPSKFPVPMYFAPPMHMCRFSYTSSSGLTGSSKDQTQCSCSSCSTTHSAASAGSRTALLNSGKTDVHLAGFNYAILCVCVCVFFSHSRIKLKALIRLGLVL